MSDGSKPRRRALGEPEASPDPGTRRHRGRRNSGPYHIQPYRGHGTEDTLFLSGRVFAGRPVPSARQDDRAIRNLWHTLRRLGSSEVPAVQVSATVDSVTVTTVANEEGFFEVALPVSTPPGAGEAWRAVTLQLVEPTAAGAPAAAQGFSIVPPAEARFGIISDIDDTVVKTDVTNLLRMLRLVLLTNAHTRLPFAGVAAFYRALHEGLAGPFTNPIFYVSSSPWNFYDLLTEVFDVHDIPVGPLFLKDYGLGRDLLLSRGHMEHKVAAIDRILATYPHLRFVLIGDSGQKDPEIYHETVRRHPGRIEAIYIRDVSASDRDAEVHAIAADISADGIEMVLVQDTVAAAEHAASRGLIDPAALPEIRGERAQDLAAPGPFESVLERGR